MSKEEILERIESGQCTSIKECEQWIRTMNNYLNVPLRLKKGDVFKYTDHFKSRPCVIYKIIGDLCVCIPLSTTKDEMSIHNYNSRFFGNNYFSKSILFFKKKEVETRILGILDDNKNLNIAYKMIKDLL